jgi:hypothetical protein
MILHLERSHFSVLKDLYVRRLRHYFHTFSYIQLLTRAISYRLD